MANGAGFVELSEVAQQLGVPTASGCDLPPLYSYNLAP